MYCRNETGQDLDYGDDSVEMCILAYYGVGIVHVVLNL